MDEAEIQIVAEELAKIGGTSWYPGREQHGPVLRVIHQRYRDRARAAIAALDRYRATKAGTASSMGPTSVDGEIAPSPIPDIRIQVGTSIVYRPPGDRRAYPCTVQKISDGFAYLVPENRTSIGWVRLADLLVSAVSEESPPETA
jgi:hypothetical protein